MMYDAFSSDYDRFVDWHSRLAYELPFLLEQLKGAGARHILDAACGTGMHAIALAQAGFDVVGADCSAGMIERARANAREAHLTMQFEQAGFGELEGTFGGGQFEAVLCLGNSLPHALSSTQVEASLRDFAAVLKPGSLVIIQNRNFDSVMANQARWMEPQPAREGEKEWLFLRFYDFDPDGLLTFNIISLRREAGEPWEQSIQGTRLRPLLVGELRTALTGAGFQPIALYGDMKGNAFDVNSSGTLVACARLKGEDAFTHRAGVNP
jgi:SAM-dependent methyltransferase